LNKETLTAMIQAEEKSVSFFNSFKRPQQQISFQSEKGSCKVPLSKMQTANIFWIGLQTFLWADGSKPSCILKTEVSLCI